MSLDSQLVGLLGDAYRKPFYWFLFVSIVFGILETAGLAFILPYLDVVGRYASGEPQGEILVIAQYFGFEIDGINIVYGASFVLFVLMALKYALQIYVSYLSAVLPYDLYKFHGSLLAKKYNRLEWVEFSKLNSNEIIKNVTKANELLAYSYVVYLQYLTSIVIIFLLILALLVVNFLSAVVLLSIFSVLAGVTYLSMRKSQLHAGQDREAGLTAVFKLGSELFLGNREIKITGTSYFFEQNFSSALSQLAEAFKRTTFFPRVPVVVIELGAVIVLLVVVLAAVKFEYNLEALVGYLIFYAAVGKRLLPSISTLIFCKSTLKNLTPTIDNLHHELNLEVFFDRAETEFTGEPTAKLNTWSEISLDNISFSYGMKKNILSELSITIERNKRLALIGPSGAGKSTIVDILTGLLKPDSGALRIDDVEKKDFSVLGPMIGYVPQMPFILDASIAKNVAFGQSHVDEERLSIALNLAHLATFVQSLDAGVDTVVGERGVKLSGGQRQRLAIARALYNNPEIIVFDEATSALDNLSEKIVSEAINDLAESRTVICVAHRLSTIKHFDVICFVRDGRITHKGSHSDLLLNCPDYRKMNDAVDYS